MRIGSVAAPASAEAPISSETSFASPGMNRATTHPRYRRGIGAVNTNSLRVGASSPAAFNSTGEPEAGSPLHAAPKPDGTVSRMVAVA